eukprot:CAMPEP_0175076824 /NCGR_PEP_ID=MMETSP0052_2-20121109/22987_1 /TAXON_ID=51329 ORGANISM="Polytomella parva, Strain SAG 63-3" /NCGR_SAMPLE_ID=MMETSP0052_2 /ASSEMBLY_ACC=CAM_ASM_000194 /LENGTH=54 /DNA_ID=CAMNT_0016346097 /DNA_START=378 /DNA_END=542 /DNA_ORIENTATION=-
MSMTVDHELLCGRGYVVERIDGLHHPLLQGADDDVEAPACDSIVGSGRGGGGEG